MRRQFLMIALICPVASLALGGCIPKRVTPDDVLEQVRTGLALPPQARMPIPWAAPLEPELATLIDRVWQSHPSVRQAQADVLVAMADLGLVDPDLLPTVSAESSTIQEHDSEAFVPDRRRSRLGLRAAWQIDLWGIGRLERQARLAALESAVADGRRVLLDLAGEAVLTAIELERLDGARSLARAEVAALDAQLVVLRQRVDDGSLDRIEIDRVQAERAVALSESVRLDVEWSLRVESLLTLAGRGGPVPATPPALLARLPAALPDLPPEACLLSPEARSAAMAVQRDGAEVEAVRRSILPTLSLSTDVALVAAQPGSVLSTGAGVWQAGASVSLPLLDAGSWRNRWIRARAGMRRSEAAYATTLADGLERIARGRHEIEAFAQRIAALEDACAAADRFADVVAQRIASGTLDVLDLLDARRRALQAANDLLQARYDRLATRLRLLVALGVVPTAQSDDQIDDLLLPPRQP